MIFANTKEWLQDYGIDVYHLGTTVEQLKRSFGEPICGSYDCSYVRRKERSWWFKVFVYETLPKRRR